MFSSETPDSAPEKQTEATTREEIHTGYDFESGLLARARQWTDVLPWLRLVRVMRVAGSPPLVFLVAVTFSVWLCGHSNFFSDVISPKFSTLETGKPSVSSEMLGMLPSYARLLIPTDVFQLGSRGPWWQPFAAVLWALLTWIPTTLLLVRQGGLLTANRPMMGFVDAGKLAIRRSHYAMIVAWVPLLCVLFIGFALVALGWISRIGDWLAFPLSALIVIIAIACGLLAFGANAAVPLGWAALVNEKDPDPLDSLSRGYEYLYRRPLQLLTHGAMSLLILIIVTNLAVFIATSAASVSNQALAIAGATERTIDCSLLLLRYFPTVVAITLFWSLVGGVYLLMRYDANGQEVEDIWQPPLEPETALPELRK